jgi:hypothetical protein
MPEVRNGLQIVSSSAGNGFDFLAAQQWNGRIAVVAQEASS